MVELVETPIPDLVVLRLELHEDSRGWFKENWQRKKMLAAAVGVETDDVLFHPVTIGVALSGDRRCQQEQREQESQQWRTRWSTGLHQLALAGFVHQHFPGSVSLIASEWRVSGELVRT